MFKKEFETKRKNLKQRERIWNGYSAPNFHSTCKLFPESLRNTIKEN